MRKEIILPVTAILGGAVGFGLRRWELGTAFEPETGLAIPGMPATYALVGFTAVMALVLALLCRGSHQDFPGGYDQAFAAKGNTVYITALVAAALLCAAGGAVTLLGVPGAFELAGTGPEISGSPYLTVLPRALLGVFALWAAMSIFTVGRNNYKGEGKGKYSSALLVPSYTCCFWLIVAYQARSGDPVVLEYVWQLLAIMAAVLGTYFMAGFAFERSKVFRSSYFSLLAVYFILLTLADGHPLWMVLLYAGFFLYFTASVTALQFNCARPLGPRMRGDGEAADLPDRQHDREGTPDEG